MGNYLTAFFVGGLICALGQIFLDNTKYTPAHLLVGLVILGSIFTGLGWYDKLIKFAGAGITVPVSNFGYVLTKGVLMEAQKDGLLGLFKGVFKMASAGVSASVIIAFFIASLFNPRV
ncbi:stage V sporulation protein AE [Halothermothrix orenii]|uniref:Sporulation stage V protein AE n=1 Tax=Halothermothrix orenii (strain H 168 / OCM 544 / DSM 9562) TaxID=373903 RepID=B8CVZ5_HALOH|nr:stage V sporulation protein AE [Halothermothrix orenii]ACL69464.1 Sporulation stage V protein AE [Halothermothrix orenii H 168]